jgi:hypothetical protein
MAKIIMPEGTPVGNPPTGYHYVYLDAADGRLKIKHEDGTINETATPTEIHGGDAGGN